MNKRLIKVAVD